MLKFTLKNILAVNGKQEFSELVIDAKNDSELEIKGQLTEFEQSLKGTNYEIELKTILAYMSFLSNLNGLPKTKFKDITPDKEEVKEYEFKSKHLRIYCIKKPNGKIVILGGYKNNQPSDIIKFRSLKQQYLKSLKS